MSYPPSYSGVQPPNPVNSGQQATGYRSMPAVHPSPVAGFPPTPTGYPPAATGYQPAATGYPPAATAYPPANTGYAPTMGFPPSAAGFPFTSHAPAFPPAPSAYPGYPPAATGAGAMGAAAGWFYYLQCLRVGGPEEAGYSAVKMLNHLLYAGQSQGI